MDDVADDRCECSRRRVILSCARFRAFLLARWMHRKAVVRFSCSAVSLSPFWKCRAFRLVDFFPRHDGPAVSLLAFSARALVSLSSCYVSPVRDSER